MDNKVLNPNASQLSMYNYENFLNVYQSRDTNDLYFNLCRGISIIIDENTGLTTTYLTEPIDTWYYISYKVYGTMDLWWLVLICNPAYTPVTIPEPGSRLQLIKPEFISLILNEITKQVTQ